MAQMFGWLWSSCSDGVIYCDYDETGSSGDTGTSTTSGSSSSSNSVAAGEGSRLNHQHHPQNTAFSNGGKGPRNHLDGTTPPLKRDKDGTVVSLEVQKRREANRLREQRRRLMMTPEERAMAKEKHRVQERERRRNMTQEEWEAQKRKNRERARRRRAEMNEMEKEETKEKRNMEARRRRAGKGRSAF